MTTEACPERSAFRAASSIYRRCPFLPRPGFLSVRSRSPSRRPWFQRNDGEEGMPRRVLSILCIVEQLRPTPRIQAICEYTFSLYFPPQFDLFHCLSFSLLSVFLSLYFSFFRFHSPPPLSLSLSPLCLLPRSGRHFVLCGVANASAMTAAYSQND